MRWAIYIASVSMLARCVSAGDASAIRGVVRDSSGHVLPGAEVRIQSDSTGSQRRITSDETGYYFVAGLPPDQYKLTVRFPGFRTVSRIGVVLKAERETIIDFDMELLTMHEVITVSGGQDPIDPTGRDSLILTHGSPGAMLPANGPDYRTLFDLMPGVLMTPAGASDGGQFSSNGQRPNANAFRVDGVNANTGLGGSTLPGSFPGASLPAMTAIGSTQNLGSTESTQSVELRTSGFAPEMASRLGAEALVNTRSGTNAFHGEFFGNLRDTDWNARDWFANANGLAYSRPSYENLGGVFSGPLWRNRTFFLVSIEDSHITDSGLELIAVPSVATRQDAPPGLQPILASFPSPTGSNLGSGEAEGLIGLNRTGSLGSYSARLDQALGSLGSAFIRYVRSPSSSSSSDTNVTQGVLDWRSTTFGITIGRHGLISDIRVNYSRADFRSTYNESPSWPTFALTGLLPNSASGGIWPSITSLLPQSGSSANVWGVSIPDLGQFISGEYGTSRQDQWEFGYTISKELKGHALRIGFDYLRLKPSRGSALTTILGEIPNLQSLVAGVPLAVTVSQVPQFGSNVQVGSFFAQDTFQAAENLNIVYGVRWELTPPIAQLQIPTLSGLWTGTEWTTTHTGDINGTAPWPMRYGQFAPRLGLAYRLPKSGIVFRAGTGIFYDASLGASINPINGAAFNSWLLPVGTLAAPSTGSTSANSSSSSGMAADVLKFLAGPYAPLRLPMSFQSRISLEKSLPLRGVVSVAYLGSVNRHLLGNEAYIDPSTGVLERGITLTDNSSSYNALQGRYSGSVGRHLYVSTSYTWSHCIDDGSEDSSVFLVHPGYQLGEARAACDFDIRQAVTTAISYEGPRFTMAALSGWTISGIFRARSGFPINVVDVEQALGQNVVNAVRPDLVPEMSIWINDPLVAGGRRLNPAAFVAPTNGQQGTLGRNAIYGNGLAQLDISLRREFELFRRTSLEVRLNVFNVLNHPAFADPVAFLSSPLFGQSISMQNLMMGSGTPSTGLPPLFQTGGSRSAELSLRFSF